MVSIVRPRDVDTFVSSYKVFRYAHQPFSAGPLPEGRGTRYIIPGTIEAASIVGQNDLKAVALLNPKRSESYEFCF